MNRIFVLFISFWSIHSFAQIPTEQSLPNTKSEQRESRYGEDQSNQDPEMEGFAGQVRGGDAREQKAYKIIDQISNFLNSRDEQTLRMLSDFNKEQIENELKKIHVGVENEKEPVSLEMRCEQKHFSLKRCKQRNLFIKDDFFTDQENISPEEQQQTRAKQILALVIESLNSNEDKVNLNTLSTHTFSLVTVMQAQAIQEHKEKIFGIHSVMPNPHLD